MCSRYTNYLMCYICAPFIPSQYWCVPGTPITWCATSVRRSSRHNIDVFQVHELPDVLHLCAVHPVTILMCSRYTNYLMCYICASFIPSQYWCVPGTRTTWCVTSVRRSSRHNIAVFQVHQLSDVLYLCAVHSVTILLCSRYTNYLMCYICAPFIPSQYCCVPGTPTIWCAISVRRSFRHNIAVFQVHQLPDVLHLCAVPEQVLRPGEADGLWGVL